MFSKQSNNLNNSVIALLFHSRNKEPKNSLKFVVYSYSTQEVHNRVTTSILVFPNSQNKVMDYFLTSVLGLPQKKIFLSTISY